MLPKGIHVTPSAYDPLMPGGLPDQYVDADPSETAEWLESFDAVVDNAGPARARSLMLELLRRAAERSVGVPALRSTDYINSISPDKEPGFPGDEEMERQIRAITRWNAAMLVHRAQRPGVGVGGHISTYASARGAVRGRLQPLLPRPRRPRRWRPDLLPGPRLARHVRPRVPRGTAQRGPARRLPPGALARRPAACPPTRTRGSCPSSGSSRRCRWASARSTRSTRRGSTATCTTAASRTPASSGSGRSSATARWTSPSPSAPSAWPPGRSLDNLTFVVNCNLQRLDGPVRGNGNIIQELESFFRGAGWNVIKVIWGRELGRAARPRRRRRAGRADEQHPRRRLPDVPRRGRRFLRENFFGRDPRVAQDGRGHPR